MKKITKSYLLFIEVFSGLKSKFRESWFKKKISVRVGLYLRNEYLQIYIHSDGRIKNILLHHNLIDNCCLISRAIPIIFDTNDWKALPLGQIWYNWENFKSSSQKYPHFQASICNGKHFVVLNSLVHTFFCCWRDLVWKNVQKYLNFFRHYILFGNK